MDAANFNFNNQNQLKKLKESLTEFVAVTNNIKVLLHSNKFANGSNGNDNQHDSIILPNKTNSMAELDCITSGKKSALSIVCQNVIKSASEFGCLIDGNKCVHKSNVFPNVVKEVPEFCCVNSGNNSAHKSNVCVNVIKAVPEFSFVNSGYKSAHKSNVCPNVIKAVPVFDDGLHTTCSDTLPTGCDGGQNIILLNGSNAASEFDGGNGSPHNAVICQDGIEAVTQSDDGLHTTNIGCSDVHVDEEMDLDKEHASEKALENVSIKTYPQLIEITDVVNWNNFQKLTIGSETFYTDGEFTYEPAMDVMNLDIEKLAEIIIDDVDIGENMDQQNKELEFVSENDEDLEIVVEETGQAALTIAPTVIEWKHRFMANQIVKPSIDLDLARPEREADIRDCRKFGFEIERHQGCDKNKMFVSTSERKTKKLCCMYCLKRYSKLERHLRLSHKNEAEVKTFVALPLRSKSRRDAIARIRKRGEFLWNSDLKLNGGEFQTSRRPNKKFGTQPWQRIACANCFGSYSTNTLRNHWRKCTKKTITGERVAKQLGRALEGRIHPDASDDLNEIFAQFRDSARIRKVQFDWLVTYYGNELCLNYSPHYQEGYIRSKLSAAAKVLEFAKEISSEISDLSSLFHVKNCNTVIEAIRKMGKFDRQSKLFGSPGTASTTVTLINAIAELLIVECMKLDDEEKERNAERFLKVFKRDVKTKINKLVAVTIAKKRRGKKLNIPTTADIKKLSDFLDNERDACYLQLTEKYSYQKWLQLAQLTLVSIMVFNRKRAGEMRNLLITDFREREIIAELPDMILETISEEMKNEIKSRMVIRGKKDRDVPAFLKQSWEDCIDLLIRYRGNAGIPEANDFIFSLPTQTWKVKTVNVWAAINSYAKRCGAQNPSSLKGTNLRKHLASYCATQDLNDRDITNLADFMGHDERIHLKIYRQNPLVSQVSQLAPILNSAQGNSNNQTKIVKAKPARVVYQSDTDSNVESDSNFVSDSNIDSDSSDDYSEEVNKTVRKRCIIRSRKKGQSEKVSKFRGTKANDSSGKKVVVCQARKRKKSTVPKISKKSKASE